MNSKIDKPRTTRRRQDPDEAPGKRGQAVSWVGRVMLLVLAVVACGIGALLLYSRWQNRDSVDRVLIDGGNADLSTSERLLLEAYLASHAGALEEPAGAASESVTFVIPIGEPASQIVSNLKANDLLTDDKLFTNYLRYHGLDKGLNAGTFVVSPGLTIPELATLLSNPYQKIGLSFLPGWRLEEMAAYLAATTPAQIDAEEFQAIAQRRQPFDLTPHAFLVGHPAGASLEGYLFPGVYELPVDATTSELVAMMLARFDQEMTPAMRQANGANGLSLRDAVTLASIVERETPIDDERALIAGVFLNRLARDMPLQADSTAQYALGFDAASGKWWKSPLMHSDLEVSSQYNTYQVPALPPGPIANPGFPSLQAVAYPDESDFLFFVLDCETQAGHLFSETYEEHLANVERCLAP